MPPDLSDTLARIREITTRFGGAAAQQPVTAGNGAFAQTLSAALGATSGTDTSAALSSLLGTGTTAGTTDASSVTSAIRALLGATSATTGTTGTTGTSSGTATTGAALGEQAVTLAKSYSGTPYLWGGTDPDKGLDCSGLTQLVFRRLGVDLPRTSAEQAKVGEKVASLADARPGDLVFFGSPVHHVGVYAGDGMMVDAPHKGATVGLHKVWSSVSGVRRVATDDAAQGSRTAQLQAVAAALPALSQLSALSALDGSSGASGASGASGTGGAAGSYASLVRLPGAGTSSGSVDDLLAALARRTALGATTGATTGATAPGAASGTFSDPVGAGRSRTTGVTAPGAASGTLTDPVGTGRSRGTGPSATLPGTRSGGLPGVGGGSQSVSQNGSGPAARTVTTTVNALLAAERGYGYGAPGGIMGSAGEHEVTLPVSGTAAAAAGTATTAATASYATTGASAVSVAEATSAAAGSWRTAPYADLFAAAGAKYDVDPALLSAIAKAESGYRPSVTSHAGAVGLMQIMPSTARGLGVDPTDPAQAVDGAARLVQRYLKTYDGDVNKVLAAYNAGPGAVKKYGGVPPYAETRTYVHRVTGYWEDLR